MVRSALGLFTAIVVQLLTALTPSQAQTRAVTIVVPFTPGTVPDLLARTIGEELQSRIGQPVVVENKPGASGNLGTYQVARAAPDGHTLLMTTASHVVTNIGSFKKFAFDPITSFEPIIQIATGSLVLVISNNTPATTLREYIDYSRANPGKLNYASPGPMSAQHLAGEMFKTVTKTDAIHVPYPGSAGAVRDIVAGHVNAVFLPFDTLLPLLADNKLRALAVVSDSRSPLAPQIPTMKEQGIEGIEVSLWFGVLAPAGTPKDIVERYNRLINEIVLLPRFREDFPRRGLTLVGGPPSRFEKFIADEVRRWTKVIADAGLKPDSN